jgi:hypothetical protein
MMFANIQPFSGTFVKSISYVALSIHSIGLHMKLICQRDLKTAQKIGIHALPPQSLMRETGTSEKKFQTDKRHFTLNRTIFYKVLLNESIGLHMKLI